MAANDREIERKFLLRALPPHVKDAARAEIDQGYLPGSRINERVRRLRNDRETRYLRTIKSGAGLSRMEIEEETTEEFFLAVWPLTRGARVRKRRYFVRATDGTWEIDEFLDRPELVLAEFEMESVEQRVAPPDWLAPYIVREVTDDPRYTNHALAM